MLVFSKVQKHNSLRNAQKRKMQKYLYEKVFENAEDGQDAETGMPAKPNTSYQKLNENENSETEATAEFQGSRAFCTPYVVLRIIGIFLCGFALAIIGTLLWIPLRPLAIIFGSIGPPTVLMVWFSEAVGRTSVDRGQVAIVLFTCIAFTFVWLLLYLIFFNQLITSITSSTSKAFDDPWYVTSTFRSQQEHTFIYFF